MRIRHANLFPVLLLFEPNESNAARLAADLAAAGFSTHIEANAARALQTLRKSFYFALIVVADLTHKEGLATLQALRGSARRSWLIVAAPRCDTHTSDLIHRHGADVCISWPISAADLIARLDGFQLRERPSF